MDLSSMAGGDETTTNDDNKSAGMTSDSNADVSPGAPVSSSGFDFQQQSQGQLSAGASAASAAAAAAAAAAATAAAAASKAGIANDTPTPTGPVSSDPNSIQSILANNMPKHLMDRSDSGGDGDGALSSSMPPGLSGQGVGGPPMGAVAAAAAANQHHPIAEFLYQLTKMLTDDNSEVIEWVDGRIKVHYPERLEGEVLHKYFRHSKFASFQRQLNYFGFRKIAGKGKMSPCSYVNESATSDIRSLLLIKRKTNGSAARKAMAQRSAALHLTNGLGGVGGMTVNGVPGMVNAALGTGLPGLAGLSLQLQMQKQLGVNVSPATAAAAAALHSNAGNALGLDAFSGGATAPVPGAATNPLSQLLLQNQVAPAAGGVGRHSFADLQQLGVAVGGPGAALPGAPVASNGFSQPPPTAMATLEQLQAQLAQLQSQAAAAGVVDGAASAALNAASLNLAQASGGLSQLRPGVGPASAAANTFAPGGTSDNPATAALNASAALDNPASVAAQSQAANMNSLFESATNLKALIGNETADTKAAASALTGLPSSGTFTGNISNVSLGNLLSSNARLSSLLSLNSFLSREPSLADLAMMQPSARNNTVNQYAAFQQHAAQQQQMNPGGGAPTAGPS